MEHKLKAPRTDYSAENGSKKVNFGLDPFKVINRSTSAEDLTKVGYEIFNPFYTKKANTPPAYNVSGFSFNDSVQSLPQKSNVNIETISKSKTLSEKTKNSKDNKSQKSSLNLLMPKEIINLNPISFFSKASFGYSKSKSENALSDKPLLRPVVIRSNFVATDRATWRDSLSEGEIDKLNLSQKEVHKQQVIYEAIVTEGDYLRDLKIVRDVSDFLFKMNITIF
ncbi:hypothetical protein AYI69_g766 [Smittium culicis]|uniref:DH domain-containing protein n=1 Tax=Smittium culicis TaxID=133412 RepID=A0A1R1YS55_9FUNG|nr:hypothetical protein AYI69_g10193 [Smittium culicis]OMJ29722.1 hypothetical protein AYI69_g766 [Smittium culicis]